MATELNERNDTVTAAAVSHRIGLAKISTLAFRGTDLSPFRDDLIARLSDGTASAGDGLDLSLVVQIQGDKQTGLAIQAQVLTLHQLFRLPCRLEQPKLRVLALAAAIDMGGNTPIEFLLEDSEIELTTLYVIPEVGLPQQLPDHDIAIVIASDSEECRPALAIIDQAAPRWPRPLLNSPHLIGNLDRDKLHRLLDGIEGLEIPATLCASRAQLSDVARSDLSLSGVAPGLEFPVIVRPRGSHAGLGLARIDDCSAMTAYLEEWPEQEFFISRFVDYSSEDGQFRKYRVVFVDGRPFACHMAIADRWDIWYLNAGMSESPAKRLEEATFMLTFDAGFGRRHRTALAALAERVELEYFTIDCAENKRGDLLIFEADNTAVVHNMDPPELFPYKPPQMHAIFDAFAAMLVRRAVEGREQAA
jgi:hypothetical protein